jgi:CBS domain-containing protein
MARAEPGVTPAGAAAFLGGFAPFAGLEPEQLDAVAGVAELVAYPAGAVILTEDGAPSAGLYVVRSGAVELRHEEELIDVLEPGECFGHPSLLSGLAPAFDVLARDATEAFVIPGPAATAVLASPAGVQFVASSLRERLVRTGHVAHAQADQRTAHLGSLVHRPVAVCPPDTTARDAARMMAGADVSCVLVQLEDGFGIVTDSDLRRRLVARGLSLETPVRELMAAPAMTFAPDRLAVDAMIDMLDAGIHHLPIVDARGTPLGVVTATDLMYLESRTPFALRRSIAHAADVDALVAAASHLPQMMVSLLRAGVAALDVSRVIALQSDTATTRLIELAHTARGPAPVAWSWMALGSTARREATLASDQDNALAYADAADPAAADAHFAEVAADVNAALARCGFGADNAEVLARNRVWRMAQSDWMRVFTDCLDHPDRSHLVRAAVAFDFRHVTGGLDIVRPLVEIERGAPRHPDFIRRLARTATDFTPPLGFRGKLTTGDDGRVDLKRGGVVPIANLARFHALQAGVTISGTLQRLEAAAEAGTVGRETASALTEAFELLTRLRLEHQVRQVETGAKADNRVDPGELPPLTRAQLKSAFHAVADAQKALSRFVPLGL